MREKIAWIILGLVLVFCLSACQTAVPGPRPFTIACATAPAVLDPVAATDPASIILLQSLSEGLVVANPGGNEALPGMAQAWDQSDDGQAYTFHLRQAAWPDGSPVTAQQFVDSWLRLLDPKNASPHAWLLTGLVAGAREYGEYLAEGSRSADREAALLRRLQLKALDDQTLYLKTLTATPSLPLALANPAFLPVKIAKDGSFSLGNGPYFLNAPKEKDDNSYTLERNSAYWDAGNIHLDRFRLVVAGDDDRALAAYRQGLADYLPELHIDPKLNPAELSDWQESPGLESIYLLFNCRDKPWSDYRVRAALSLAIDRTALLSSLANPGITPANDIVSGGGNALASNSVPDLGIARDWLAKAGYGKGRALPEINFLTSDSPTDRKLAEALQTQWRQSLGIKLTIHALPRRDYLIQRRLGNFDLARGGWRSGVADAAEFLAPYASDFPANDGAWVNPEYDALVGKLARTGLGPARDKIVNQAMEILAKQMPAIPLYQTRNVSLINPRVWGGWQANAANIHLVKFLYKIK